MPTAGPDQGGLLLRTDALSEDPGIDRTLRSTFDALYASPGSARTAYQSLSQFAGSAEASGLLAAGGARGAERLGPLHPDLPAAQRDTAPRALGQALGAFAPEQEGAVGRIVPGATVLRDEQGVPVVMAARGPGQQAEARGQERGVETIQWVAGVGIEARGQAGFVSGSVVSGIVFDEDGTYGTFTAIGAGPGIGAGGQVGPTAFGIVGPQEITDIGGLGVQFGGFAGAGATVDAGVTIPLNSRGGPAGAGITLPAGPAAGVGVGAYSEVGYTHVRRLFEIRDLQTRGGAVLEDLGGTPRRAVDGMMAGLGIRSYDEMASYLVGLRQSVARQIGGGR